MSSQNFIKNVGIIGISKMLTSLSGFLLLPIITKTLGSSDYGIWAQINITISLLAPVALLGLQTTTVRYLSSEKDIDRIKDGFYSI